MMTPIQAFCLSIEKWEGLYQDDPEDVGNVRGRDGIVIGTMRGVTPGAWSTFLNRPIEEITVGMMKAISLTDAARVYEQNYYKAPGFDKFDWGPSIDVACDIGWGSGPVRGIRAVQTLSGAPIDGVVGPKTIEAHKSWLAEIGDAASVDALAEWRRQWYRHIVQVRPSNGKFLKGWLNRANWQSTKSPWWQMWLTSGPAPSPQSEPVPSAPQRASVESIGANTLDILEHEVAQTLFAMFPSLGVAAALLRRVFG